MAIKDVLDFEGLSHFTEKIKTFVTDITSKLETNKANIASPILTGTPKAPTATAGTNTTQIATTAFVQTAVSNLVDSAPETLDTLGEIADALKDNADIVDVLNDSIATKANTSDLTSHTSNTTVHITATERTNWNNANSKKHTHSNKSILDNTTASYTTNEQTKLSGIATGAEVNQNAFSNVKVGSTTVSADTTTDTLELVAGSNITITPDATNDKITISSSHPTISKNTNTTSTASPSAGGTFTTIDSITQDSNGHVTKFNTKTVTLPSTSITVDSALSSTSTNPVQNKVIYSNIAYNINGKKLYNDYDYENGMIGEYEGIGYSYPPATNTRFENLITQCIKGDMQKAKKTSVLSTVSECTASTNSTDIASASALAELNNSLTGKSLFNNGGSDADVLNNGISCYIVPFASSGWKYANIYNAWYLVISINFASNHYQQYWLGLTTTHVYQRGTDNSGSTWTVTELH